MIPRAILPARPPHPVLPPGGTFISAKLQRRRRPPRHSHENVDLEELGAAGFSDLTALKSGSTHMQPPSPAVSQQPQEAEASVDAEGRTEWRSGGSLSGSDVLMALQRAAAAGGTQKNKKRSGRRTKRGGEVGGGDEAGGGYHGDVRPLNIRSDWASRLDEMERALQDLLRPSALSYSLSKIKEIKSGV